VDAHHDGVSDHGEIADDRSHNRFAELVGCRLPIQLAAMSRIVTPLLAAEVSNHGGLGMLAIGRSKGPATRRQIDEVRALTDRPIGAGFIVLFLDREALDVVAEELPVVEFFWGWPDPSLVPADRICGWQVGTVDEARAAVDAGCQYVVAQGAEAGGHVRGTISRLQFLDDVRAAVDVPVVATGGISTSEDVRQAMAAGADGVRVGTRFVATVESDAHDVYVDRLIASTAADSVVTGRFDVGWPDAPVRVLASSLRAAEQAPPGTVATITAADGSATELPLFSTTAPIRSAVGNLDAMPHYAGTGLDAITRRATVAEVMAELSQGFA
jgi:NAD(P)H-dependent flavin oxidoreductase YrpB (nitropropane dioxygenase family)